VEVSGVAFFVAGQAIGKARPRVTRRGTFMPTPYLQWLQVVRDEALVACAELEDRGEPWNAAREGYVVRLRFALGDRRRRDIDNLAGAILDALNGLLWGDDSAVMDLRATKTWDPARPGVEVEVRAT
jgi:hypothetical protein